MKHLDVVALGELLIDFTENGLSSQGNPLMEANPGGAPCNVLAMLTKLGKKTGFIGKVGRDMFGTLLRTTLEKAGIDTQGLMTDDTIHTTLAFVHTAEDGDRDFSFYRNPGADMMLKEEEVPEELIQHAKIFHFGTLSMTHEGVRRATLKALRCAKENGLLISFDPNLRPPLWDSLEEAKTQIELGLSWCDVLKISDNEVQFLTGLEDYDQAAGKIMHNHPNIRILFLTLGKDGSRAYYRGLCVHQNGYHVSTVDTCGAGDTFCGCALWYLLEHDWSTLDESHLRELLGFANAAAALVTTRKGAIRSMPELQEIQKLTTVR